MASSSSTNQDSTNTHLPPDESENLTTDPKISDKPFRLKPWIHRWKNQDQSPSWILSKSSFPAPLLTDANTVLQAFLRGKRVKLEQERMEKLEYVFSSSSDTNSSLYRCEGFSSLKQLENLVREKKLELQSTTP